MTTDGSGRSSVQRPRPRTQRLAVGVTVLVMATHMFFTAVYNMPSEGLRSILPTEVAAEYMEPLFVQDYKIFAPDPASADHQLWVRAWLEDGSGEPTTTEWVNVTDVELSSQYRQVLRKHMTVVGAERIMAAYSRLDDAQKEVAATNYHRVGLDQLARDLREANPAGDPATVASFVRSTRYVDAYATQVAFALGATPDDLAAVQTRAVYDPVVRWADRNDPEATRPAATFTDTGWRQPVEFSGQDRDAFASAFVAWMDE